MTGPSAHWALYRTFLAVCSGGSYSAAARELRLTHPTVSRRMTELEGVLGVRLLARSGEGYVVTEAGELFRQRVEAMAHAADLAERELKAGRGGVRGLVKVSISESLANAWLCPHLASLYEAYPELELQFGTRDWPASVRNGRADVLVRLFGPGGENLVGRRIGYLGAGFYASTGYVADRGAPASRSEWSRHALISFTGEGPEAELARWSDHVTGGRSARLRFSSGAGALAAVRQGLGVAPLACIIGDGDPDLVRIAPHLGTRSEMWLLAHPDLRDTAPVRAVLGFIGDRALRDAPSLRGETGGRAQSGPCSASRALK